MAIKVKVLPFLVLLAFTAIYAGGPDTSGVTAPFAIYDDGSVGFSIETLVSVMEADSGHKGYYTIAHYGKYKTEIFVSSDKKTVRFKGNYPYYPRPVPASVSDSLRLKTQVVENKMKRSFFFP